MKILFIAFLFSTSTLRYTDKPHIYQSQKKGAGKIALDKVSDLPEVADYLRRYEKRKAMAVLYNSPGDNFKYYSIKVGITDIGLLSTNFDFYVDPKTYQIFYADHMTEQGEQLLTLEQWRKWRRLPVWQKWHCYKHLDKKLVIYACKP